ncbi:ComEA family DNA-binding protein [Acinetobacter shaoyimingii]|uniref:ComEA family DNA-binding protein n=1 Tax=Acinetobacter shaoyimingii TaxID=2715164 RepID=A0A6G8RT15_9GAMM|nr:ComEA family DNA-binding protein [Acinetobacter shaoyimingii]NHB56457.1 ComEA family DNA-binding protein [Acinetobacter shaoyimingii]QIO05041.1 ComEA family DNA-binding protein [Acinetobacter shaoyimingii]
MNNLILKCSLYSVVGLFLSLSIPSHAEKFDQAYLKWKAEQAAQDQKLKMNDPNHYLSRPTVQSKNTSTSASNASLSGKIRLNSASVSELQQLSGVGLKKAQDIIEYRQQNGNFKSVEDLQNVKGIGPKLVEKNKDRLSL